ncbi:MAG: hypothetical protein ACO1SV_27635 [Fimbriimonas sp.]
MREIEEARGKLKRHQIEALLRGEATIVGGKNYTLKDFPGLALPAALLGGGAAAQNATAEAEAYRTQLQEFGAANTKLAADLRRVEGDLSAARDERDKCKTERDNAGQNALSFKASAEAEKKRADDLSAEVERLKAAASDPDLAGKHAAASALIKELTEVDAPALARMTTEQLQAIAKYRAKDVPPDANKGDLVKLLAPGG